MKQEYKTRPGDVVHKMSKAKMAQIDHAIKVAAPDPNLKRAKASNEEDPKYYEGPQKPLRTSLAEGAPISTKQLSFDEVPLLKEYDDIMKMQELIKAKGREPYKPGALAKKDKKLPKQPYLKRSVQNPLELKGLAIATLDEHQQTYKQSDAQITVTTLPPKMPKKPSAARKYYQPEAD